MSAPDDRLPYPDATTLARAVRARRISPTEIIKATLARIERLNPTLNAFISISETAVDAARAADRAAARKSRAPLLGVPISIKDLILTRDSRTTAGSKIFGAGLESDHDAPVVARLRAAGAIIIGKTNLHELALGVTSVNAHYGPVRNPWDNTRVAGGSSGGSAAAVAAGMGMASVGSDTRGSIRIPAACCGVTGIKATSGLVPTEDVIPLSWSLDHVGPITRTVNDAAVLLAIMAGDKRGTGYAAAMQRGIRGMKVGVCDYFMRDLDPVVERAVTEAIDVLRGAGARIRAVSMPQLDPSHGASAAITLAEAVTYHDRALTETPEGFDPAVRQRLEGGYSLSAPDLVRAQRQRADVVEAFNQVFAEVDCIAGATLPATAAPIGENTFHLRGRDTTLLAEYPRLTAPANLAGIPAISVPCGFSSAGLPIGFQLMSRWRNEAVVLAAGATYQQDTGWHTSMP